MHTLIMAMRIGLVVILCSFLMWSPGEIAGGKWWGPTSCSGQESSGRIPNPENLLAGGYAGTNIAGQVSILNNTMTDANGFYRVQIVNSFQGFIGIAQVNQAAGALNHQANYLGVTGSPGSAPVTGLSLNYKSQVKGNSLTLSNNFYEAHIRGSSFASGSGIALVNQAAGHLNTQLNAFTLAVGKQAENLTDTQMGAISSNNQLTPNPAAPDNHTTKLELDKGAFKDFTGIWSTNQIAGNMDQVTTIFNVRVTTVP
jgi:hypothetical protein